MSVVTDTIRNGVDTATMYATLDALKEQPELGALRVPRPNQWVDGSHNPPRSRGSTPPAAWNQRARGVECRRRRNCHPPRHGQGPNPAEYLLHALAACLTTAVIYVASARKSELSRWSRGSRARWTSAAASASMRARNGFTASV